MKRFRMKSWFVLLSLFLCACKGDVQSREAVQNPEDATYYAASQSIHLPEKVTPRISGCCMSRDAYYVLGEKGKELVLYTGALEGDGVSAVESPIELPQEMIRSITYDEAKDEVVIMSGTADGLMVRGYRSTGEQSYSVELQGNPEEISNLYATEGAFYGIAEQAVCVYQRDGSFLRQIDLPQGRFCGYGSVCGNQIYLTYTAEDGPAKMGSINDKQLQFVSEAVNPEIGELGTNTGKQLLYLKSGSLVTFHEGAKEETEVFPLSVGNLSANNIVAMTQTSSGDYKALSCNISGKDYKMKLVTIAAGRQPESGKIVIRLSGIYQELLEMNYRERVEEFNEQNETYEVVIDAIPLSGHTIEELETLLNAKLVSKDCPDLIDANTKRASFDEEEFKKLLERIRSLSMDEKEYYDVWISGEDDGRPRLEECGGDLYSIDSMCGSFYGEDFVIKVFPQSEGTSGQSFEANTLHIAANSKNKEGAYAFWEYLKSRNNDDEVSYSISVRKTRRDKDFHYYSEEHDSHWYNGEKWKLPEQVTANLREVLAQVRMDTYDNAKIRRIILEEVQGYFAGKKNLNDTCEIIQNRVQTLLDER